LQAPGSRMRIALPESEFLKPEVVDVE